MGASHLRRVLREYVAYYNADRTHLALDKDSPATRPALPPGRGQVIALARESVDSIIATTDVPPDVLRTHSLSSRHANLAAGAAATLATFLVETSRAAQGEDGVTFTRYPRCLLAIAVLPLLLRPCAAEEAPCWREGGPSLVAGSMDAVIATASRFLVKAEAVPPHPYWPGGSSGVTLGVGWDVGYHTPDAIADTWKDLGPDRVAQLQRAAGKKGRAAATVVSALRSLTVPRDVSIAILTRSLREEYYPLIIRLFPGVEHLPTEAQVVFLSVVFNRGPSMGHDPDWKTAKDVDRRWEMRRMRNDVQRRDLFAIYVHLGTMKRLWEQSGPRGLPIRRRDEQALIRPLVNQQLRFEESQDKLKQAGVPPCPGSDQHSR